MYTWLWHRLPANTPLRAGALAVLALAVAAALWFWVFPWAAGHLPIDGSAFTGLRAAGRRRRGYRAAGRPAR
jgi:hypothetical protein